MAFSWISLLTILYSTSVLSYDFGYSECLYHAYTAANKCMGQNPRLLQYENKNLEEFPTIRDQNCIKLMRNNIKRFPKDLSVMKHVVTLNLARNKINELPGDLHVMENLEVLNLHQNNVTTLSKSTSFPGSLRGLVLSGNNMKTFTEGIEIPGLFVLDLSGNMFTEIPKHFCVSSQLIKVDLTSNRIVDDVSNAMIELNRCRNVNNIPFCLYTDLPTMNCNCESLAPILAQPAAFYMGTKTPGRNIGCNKDTSEDKYKGVKIFDVNATQVKAGCSLKSYLDGDGDKSSATIISITINSVLALITIVRAF